MSSDNVDLKMFRLKCGDIKEQISVRSKQITDAIAQFITEFCTDQIHKIMNIYTEMKEKIRAVPKNEVELVTLREYVSNCPEMIENNIILMENIRDHIAILED